MSTVNVLMNSKANPCGRSICSLDQCCCANFIRVHQTFLTSSCKNVQTIRCSLLIIDSTSYFTQSDQSIPPCSQFTHNSSDQSEPQL